MLIFDTEPVSPDTPRAYWLRRFIFTTSHRGVGLQYLWLALFSVFLGMIMSLIMRVHPQ